MGTRQTISSRTTLSTGSTEYFSPGILDLASATEAHVAHRWLALGTASALLVDLDTAPGVGKSHTLTLRVNNLDTALTVVIAGTDTFGQVAIPTPLALGDLISLRHVPAGTPAATVARLVLVMDVGEAGVSCYGGSIGGATIIAGSSYKQGVFTANGWGAVGAVLVRNIVPIFGTITRLDVVLDVAPGVGKTMTFEVYVNGIAWGIGLVISGTATTGTCAPGIVCNPFDLIYIEGIGSAGAATVHALPAYRFVCLVDGSSIIASPGGAESLIASTTRYAVPRQYNQTATEANAEVLGGITDFDLQYFYGHVYPGPSTIGAHVIKVRAGRADTDLAFTTPAITFPNPELDATPNVDAIITIHPGDRWDIGIVTGVIGAGAYVNWAAVQFAMTPGVLGPLAWLEMTRRGPAESAGAPTLTDFYSDWDMQCPASWYGGFKEARVTSWGWATRTLSDPWTGDWMGSTFQVSLSDYDLSIRQRLENNVDRYWTTPSVVRMTTRANRAVLGVPYTVFVGPIVDAQPTRPLAWNLTLGDSVSNGLLSDQFQLPWRQVRDSFLSLLDEIAANLDVDTPVPIIYGEHRRIPDVDPPSPQGFVYRPTYLGIQTIGFGTCHVWLVAGHALADILDVYIDDGANPISSVLADEGTYWLIPHYGGWAAEFLGVPYVEYSSDTYATVQCYSLIYGLVGQTNPDNCAAADGWMGPPGGPAPTGSTKLLIALQGVEPIGDGTGDVILDRFQQYKHFLTNFVVYQGIDSYQFANWLPIPNWSLFDIFVPIIDEDSFDACTEIGENLLPSVGGSPPEPAGYIGAAIIGARAGDRHSAKDWITQWNRSCACRFGITHQGQLRIVMLAPTDLITEAATLFTDAIEILDQSFGVDVRWGDQANAIPFKADYDHANGQWMTLDSAIDYTSIGLYGRTITAEAREYPFAPGITQASHLASRELLLRAYVPRQVILETNVDADQLGMLELGDYIRYRHFAGVVNDPSTIRAAQIQSLSIHPGSRRVRVVAIDCEDYIIVTRFPVTIDEGLKLRDTVTAVRV